MSFEQFQDDSYSATYDPSDNKLRLYTGRVPRECYDLLVKAGFKSTPKQSCDFVATWTPTREDVCYALIAEGEDIGDEDYSMADRAADRAERFEGYRDKRWGEADDFEEKYSSGPEAFGNQNAQRAERAARKHERLKDKGVSQWSKAEYWQQRTKGVISNALHKLDPSTRRGRILELEKAIRSHEQSMSEWKVRWDAWEQIASMEDAEKQTKAARAYAGMSSGMCYDYKHPDNPDRESSLYYLLEPSEHSTDRPITGAEAAQLYLSRTQNPHTYTSRWAEHYKFRLEYENAMLENEGGKASEVEMEVGGWLGEHRIYGVNKSPATGRVTSVKIKGSWGHTKVNGRSVYMPHADSKGLVSVNIERCGEDVYRAPTQEERDEWNAMQAESKKAKKEAKKTAPPKPSLINPSPECAQRLQEIWNKYDKRWSFSSKENREPYFITQAQYSAFRHSETQLIGHDGLEHRKDYSGHMNNTPVFKVRTVNSRIVVLTDKPQKQVPWQQMDEIEDGLIPEGEVIAKLSRISEIAAECNKTMKDPSPEDWPLFTRAVQLGYAKDPSVTQKGLTDKARDAINATMEPISLEELKEKRVFTAAEFERITDPKEIMEAYEDSKYRTRNRLGEAMHPYSISAQGGTCWPTRTSM